MNRQGIMEKPLLYANCMQGKGSPEGFYRKLGFIPTGVDYGKDEIELILDVIAHTVD